MRLDRAAAALALLLTATLLPAAPAVAQSPSVVPASPGASPAAPVACPAMTDASAPVRDSAATLTLGFGAANPDPAIGGFHPGEDWALPAGSAPLAVFAVGDGQVIAVQPAVSGGRGGLVVVSHTGPFDLPAAASDAAVAAPASTEATILTVYAGIDPADDLVVGACVDGDTQLGTTTAQCAADVPEPCSELPSALHLEVRLAATADPANRSADWSVVGTAEDSIDGWFLDAATMTADGLRDPSAFLATLAGGGPIAGLDELLGTDGRLTVLLLGSDRFDAACTDRGGLGGERTDTIMFATINPRNGKVAMASLPRDTIQVPIGPGQVYGPKITGLFEQLELNSGNRKKALKKMVEAMSYFAGVEIDGYALTYFCGVKDVVDAIGGITVTLDAPLVDPTMHRGKHGLNLKAGKRKLDGGLALAFARSRHSDSDYARARRQQQVVAATLDKIKTLGPDAIPPLLDLAMDRVAKKLTRVQTDLPLTAAPALWELLGRARLTNVKSTVLAPPTYETEGTGDLLYSNFPNMTAIRSYFARVFGPVTP